MSTEPQTSKYDMSESERRRNEDAHWAQSDPQVEQQYAGQWVVAQNRQIVAHGTDATIVLREAMRITQLSAEDLLVCNIPHPASWLADA